jgi:hypothetical protein
MARQYLEDGGITEAAITDPLAANAATTETLIVSNSLRYWVIPAYDARPGKVYVFEGGGLITTAATGALTLNARIHTASSATLGNSLGASIAQTVPVSSLSGAWYLRLVLICLTTGDPGANSTIKGTGFFQSGGVAATANSGLDLTFGGTSATFDHSVTNTINITKTLSVAGLWTTQWVNMSVPN